MADKIFTFWEGPMPPYIRLCVSTWKFPFTYLNYKNLHEYTDLPIEPLQRFTLPQIADAVRVHVLRDQGGVWLDADTIMLKDQLPEEDLIGDPEARTVSIGYLRAREAHTDLFDAWAEYQDKVIADPISDANWDVLGNRFTDHYLQTHKEIRIAQVRPCWPETYMINGNANRLHKYREFYFESAYSIGDLLPTSMLMLHNSWTPEWYKNLLIREALRRTCTLSNILREVLT